jgi:OmpA-OmpF porin, OOP family
MDPSMSGQELYPWRFDLSNWKARGCSPKRSSENGDTNRTEIKSESKPTLEQIADLLKREPSLKLLVVGHTDNVGDFESNRDLSQRRAESVANALVTGFGIAPERLVSFGVSYAAPVASNATAEGRSQNRRVELVRY